MYVKMLSANPDSLVRNFMLYDGVKNVEKSSQAKAYIGSVVWLR